MSAEQRYVPAVRTVAYYALAKTPSVYHDLDGWIRHRMRACQWKQRKRCRTQLTKRRALDLPEWVAREFAFSRKGIWRLANGVDIDA